MASIEDVRQLIPLDHSLATVAVVRPDGSLQLTVVNAGVITHPVTDIPVGAFVSNSAARKLAHLRHRPRATLLWRAGWSWAALEGTAELCGPGDPLRGSPDHELPELLRNIARAAGAIPGDWDEFDRLAVAEGRTAVLVTPERIYRNP